MCCPVPLLYWQLASARSQRRLLGPQNSETSQPCPSSISMFFSSSFKCVHLLDNCIFYFLSQTRKKCVLFSCIVYKVEYETKQNKKKKKVEKTPHELIYFILILLFLFKYFFFCAVNFFFFLPKTTSSLFVRFKLSEVFKHKPGCLVMPPYTEIAVTFYLV